MPDTNISKRLQKTIIVYSALGMFIVGAAVGLVGVLPMAERLREAQKRNLLVDLQRKNMAVEQYIVRARNSAGFAGGRGRNRDKLDAYYSGAVPLNEFAPALEKTLTEQIETSTNLAGVAIFDVRSNLIVQAGLQIPPDVHPWPDPMTRDVMVIGPVRVGAETFVITGVSVFSTNEHGHGRIGTAMTAYRTRNLQSIIEDRSDLGKSGELIVGSLENKELPIFFRTRPEKAGSPSPNPRDDSIVAGLRGAGEKRSDVFEPEPPLDDSIVVAYGPVKGSDWGLVFTMDKAELFSSMNRKVAVIGSVIALLIVAGTFGMVLILRPLTGRIILHTDELESEIYQKTAALNNELGERKRFEQSLRDSEALYHSLVDTLPISILRKDLRGRVSYGNRGYCDRMGKPLSSLLGKSDYDLFPRDLADKYLRDDERVVRTGEMFEDIEEHRAGDGQKRYVHVLKAPVRDFQGKVVGTQVIFWDVTARKLAEEALEKAAAELARSNKELEQFAYVASHDLQEPLRMVTSYTQLIAKRYQGKLDEDAKEFMHFAVDGAHRMQRLIQGLLEYSRIGTRGRPFEPTDCNQALAGAMANLKLAIDEAGAEISHAPLPTLMADPVQLTQLFQNLIGNALKFRGSHPPRLQIGAERKQRPDAATLNIPPYEWIFQVRDNGIGIEPQYFERIFIIFQRLHTQEQYPGTGIGLSVCKKIVERHGGRIWIESTLGEGSTFYFALPAMD